MTQSDFTDRHPRAIAFCWALDVLLFVLGVAIYCWRIFPS